MRITQEQVMIQQDAFGQEYTRRRQQLLEKMAPASAAIFFAAPEATRSADSEYPYRQNSDKGTSPDLTSRKRCCYW